MYFVCVVVELARFGGVVRTYEKQSGRDHRHTRSTGVSSLDFSLKVAV